MYRLLSLKRWVATIIPKWNHSEIYWNCAVTAYLHPREISFTPRARFYVYVYARTCVYHRKRRRQKQVGHAPPWAQSTRATDIEKRRYDLLRLIILKTLILYWKRYIERTLAFYERKETRQKKAIRMCHLKYRNAKIIYLRCTHIAKIKVLLQVAFSIHLQELFVQAQIARRGNNEYV